MGFREVVRNSSLTLLAASLGAIGCQQSAPVRLSVASDEPGLALGDHSERTPVSSTDVPYVNPTWRDEDPPGLFMATVNLTGTALGTVFSPFIEVPAKGIQWLSGDRPSAADMLLEDRASADNRREGMNKLADFGLLGNPIFDKRCRQLAAHDVDFTVRATAIRTANRARDVSATPVFIKGLSDSDDWVRLESAKRGSAAGGIAQQPRAKSRRADCRGRRPQALSFAGGDSVA